MSSMNKLDLNFNKINFSSNEQLNYALQLIINTYESQSEFYENELKKLSENYERKYLTIEHTLESNLKTKEDMQNTIQNLVNENKSLSLQVENLINENNKLENFKSSILNSINKSEIEEINEIPAQNPLTVIKTNIFDFHKEQNTSRSNLSKTDRSAKDFKLFQEYMKDANKGNKSARNYKENSLNSHNGSNKIDSLIEKLNESINNRMQSVEETSNDKNKVNNKRHQVNVSFPENEKIIKKINDKSNNLYSNNLYNLPQNNKVSIPHTKNKIFVPSLPIQKITGRSETHTFSNSTDQIVTPKSDQYSLSTKFFSDCRVGLNEEEYSSLIETLRLCNNNKIDKSSAFKEIEKLLLTHHKLLKDFKSIFHS